MEDRRAESYKRIASSTSRKKSTGGSTGGTFTTSSGSTGYASGGVTQIKTGGADEQGGTVIYSKTYTPGSGGGGTITTPEGKTVQVQAKEESSYSNVKEARASSLSSASQLTTKQQAELQAYQEQQRQKQEDTDRVEISPALYQKIMKDKYGEQVSIKPIPEGGKVTVQAQKIPIYHPIVSTPQTSEGTSKTLTREKKTSQIIRSAEQLKALPGAQNFPLRIAGGVILAGTQLYSGIADQASYLFKPQKDYTGEVTESGEPTIRAQKQQQIKRSIGTQLSLAGSAMTTVKPKPDKIIQKEYTEPLIKKLEENPNLVNEPRALARISRELQTTTTRQLKAQGFKANDFNPPAIVAQPLETYSGVSKTVTIGKTQIQRNAIMIRKGKPEIIKTTADLPKTDYVIITAERTSTNIPTTTSRLNPRQIPTDKTLRISNKEIGNPPRYPSPSKETIKGYTITEQAKSINTAERFSQSITPKKEIINLPEAKGTRITSQNTQGIYKSTYTIGRTKEAGGLFTVKTQTVKGSITGIQSTEAGTKTNIPDYLKITKYKAPNINNLMLEDMRYRLEYANKLSLGFEGSITQTYPGGSITKFYTFNKAESILTAVKPTKTYAPPIITTTKTSTTKTPEAGKAGIETPSGPGGVLIMEPPKTEEGGVSKTKTEEPGQEGKQKKKQKPEPPEQERTGASYPGEPTYYVSTGVFEGSPRSVYNPTSPTPRPVVKVFQEARSVPIMIFKPASTSKTITDTTPKTDTAIKPSIRTSSSSRSIQISTPITGQSTGQSQAQAQSQEQAPAQPSTQILRQDQATQQEIQRNNKPIIPPVTWKNQREDKKEKDLFTTSIRRKGKFKSIGTSTSKETAARLGISAVKESAAASFKVTSQREGIIKNIITNREFTSSKREPGVFIQKRSYRISSPGEKQEITRQGILSSKKNRRRKPWVF